MRERKPAALESLYYRFEDEEEELGEEEEAEEERNDE